MDTDATNGSAQPKPKMRKVKKQVRKGDLPVSIGTPSLDPPTKDEFAEKENAMHMEDKLVADTEDKKNELESHIYELRGKIDDVYAEFASEDEKTALKEKLEVIEVSDHLRFPSPGSARWWWWLTANNHVQDWLYEEGEDATKAVYTSKMEEIRGIAGPIVQRYQDKLEAERQAAQKARDEAEAAKRAAEQAAKQAEEASKRAEEATKKATDLAGPEEATPGAGAGANGQQPQEGAGGKTDPIDLTADTEMKDVEVVKPDAVEEPAEGGKS